MIDYEVFPWHPSTDQYDRYEEREISLCVEAQRRDPRLRLADTLFSSSTWKMARDLVGVT